MKHLLLLLLLASAFIVGAADLVTKSGVTYRNFKVKEVAPEAVTIVFLAADGSPDSARLAWTELPDDLVRSLTEAKPGKTQAGFESALNALGMRFSQQLASLAPDDRAGRASLLSNIRLESRRLIARYAETADFKYISHDECGVLAQVIGTGKGGTLKSADYVYLCGGLPPATSQFRATVYPASGRGDYVTYRNVWYYGANAEYALENLLDYLALFVGNPMLFRPAAPPSQPDMYVDNSTVNNVTNIYVKPRSPYWGWGCVGPVYVSSTMGRLNTPGEKVGRDGNSVRQSIQLRSPSKGLRVSMPIPNRAR